MKTKRRSHCHGGTMGDSLKFKMLIGQTFDRLAVVAWPPINDPAPLGLDIWLAFQLTSGSEWWEVKTSEKDGWTTTMTSRGLSPRPWHDFEAWKESWLNIGQNDVG